MVGDPAGPLDDPTSFDVIVTDRLLASGIQAHAVLSLPNSDPPAWGWLRRGDRIERVALETLSQVVAVVDRICTKRDPQLDAVG